MECKSPCVKFWIVKSIFSNPSSKKEFPPVVSSGVKILLRTSVTQQFFIIYRKLLRSSWPNLLMFIFIKNNNIYLLVGPIITHEPLHRFASNTDWFTHYKHGTVLGLILKIVKIPRQSGCPCSIFCCNGYHDPYYHVINISYLVSMWPWPANPVSLIYLYINKFSST